MAINIFSGGSGGRGKSSSGSRATTVPTNTGKAATNGVAKVIGKVGDIAAKFGGLIPGVGGIVSTVGKVMSKNDPEWWMNVEGTGVSTNMPLAFLESEIDGASYRATVDTLRPAVLSITSGNQVTRSLTPVGGTAISYKDAIIWPTSSMISTYFMQDIRKVVNAVPLQAPEAYRQVFINQATAYALKHQLDKMIMLTKCSQPYLPSLTDGSFPLLAAENYPTLIGLRDRLADYCHASVRLPHTLCQYLAWRFGRVYRTGTSSKCGLVMYNVIDPAASVAHYNEYVNHILGFVASANSPVWALREAIQVNVADLESDFIVTPVAKQAAQADIFNAFKDHVIDVDIKPDTQFTFDPKEFVLRTNLDVNGDPVASSDIGPDTWVSPNPELIYMDSDLDNKTTFMASTVSTFVNDASFLYKTCLFPVKYAYAYIASLSEMARKFANMSDSSPVLVQKAGTSGAWYLVNLWKHLGRVSLNWSVHDDEPMWDREILFCAAICKALEFYNAELYISMMLEGVAGSDKHYLDMTAMSQDLARVPADVIRNTHVYAFANLVTDKVYSYAAKEMPKAIKAAEQFQTDVVDAITPSNVAVAAAPNAIK